MSGLQQSEKTSPFAIRLTENERQRLEAMAGSQPLGTYIKSVVLDDGVRRRAPRRVVADKESLAQILGLLGQSNVGARLDYLVEAIESGTLVLDQETVDAVIAACAEVHAMHGLLLKALGFQED